MRGKRTLTGIAVAAGLGLAVNASATLIIGGDAVSQSSATSIVDIVFAIDTSASMVDDIASIGAKAQSVIQNLSCPNSDCFVRARFMSFVGSSGIFNESVQNLVLGKGGVPVTNSSEDNGPAVIDLVNFYNWGTDAGPGQRNLHAIVTIGDEGTQDGQPVNQADWDVAFQANQAARNSGKFLFAWVADDPFAGVPLLFQRMAEGGLGGISTLYDFSNTGGKFVSGPLTDVTVEQQLEDIICLVSDTPDDRSNGVPEPGSFALLALGLAGLVAKRRRKVA